MESSFGQGGSLTVSSTAEEVCRRFPTAPIVLSPELPVGDLPRAILANPECQTIAVVDASGLLVGVIPVESVIRDLLVRVMPEEFLADLREPDKAIDLLREQHAHTVGDLMQPPASVLATASVREAFHRIHQAGLQGLPVLDAAGRVAGYLGLRQLLQAMLT
ncbi:MAG: CBS domain-containing protein [Chloroflexi bacterium]|nr:CBS domain-containing protein [Chloroflexota bacterium]